MDFDICIIGCGASTVSFIANLFEQKNCMKDLKIVVIDKKSNLGTGSVYREDFEWLRMNSYCYSLSAYRNKKSDFQNWLKNIKNIDENSEYFKVPRRNDFGEYLKHTFEDLRKKGFEKNISIHYLSGVVDNFLEYGDGYRVSFDGYELDAHNLFISTGVYTPKNCFSLSESSSYLKYPWPLKKNLSDLKRFKKIGVLGSSLTGMDVFLSLKKIGFNGEIALFSRKGLLPNIKPSGYKEFELKFLNSELLLEAESSNFISLNRLLKAIIREYSFWGYDWREVFSPKENHFKNNTFKMFEERYYNSSNEDDYFEFRMEVHDYLNLIFPYLKPEDLLYVRKNFVKNVFYMNGAIPRESARVMVEHLDNKVSFFSDVQNVIQENEFCTVKTIDDEIKVDFLINATGPTYESGEKIENPLLSNFLEKKYTSFNLHPRKGYVKTNKRSYTNLFAIGYVAQVQHPFNNCFENITEVNCTVAKQFLIDYLGYEKDIEESA